MLQLSQVLKRHEGESRMKYICITGATRGIGAFLAKVFLDEGYVVFAGSIEESEQLLKYKHLYEKQLHIVNMDIGSDRSVEEAAAYIYSQTTYLDVLINNAGILGDIEGTIKTDLDFDEMLKVYNINSVGPLRVTHALLPLLQAGNEKILLNISSEAGSIGNSFRTSWYAYCMSKAALNMQSAMLRDHLQEDNIKVIIMHPGWVQTFMRGKVDSDATYTPKEAAQMIYTTMRRQAAEPFSRNNFIDSEGRQLPW
jgi:NAD(P)-dependent dehydrogenase (short-subunit alcohol dehydrogenase family)